MVDTLTLEAFVINLHCIGCGARFSSVDFIADGDFFTGVTALGSVERRDVVVAQLSPAEFNAGDDGLRYFEKRVNEALGRTDLASPLPVVAIPSGIDYRCIQCHLSRAVVESSQSIEAFERDGGSILSYPIGAIILRS
jgi:hypothetical protein